MGGYRDGWSSWVDLRAHIITHRFDRCKFVDNLLLQVNGMLKSSLFVSFRTSPIALKSRGWLKVGGYEVVESMGGPQRSHHHPPILRLLHYINSEY